MITVFPEDIINMKIASEVGPSNPIHNMEKMVSLRLSKQKQTPLLKSNILTLKKETLLSKLKKHPIYKKINKNAPDPERIRAAKSIWIESNFDLIDEKLSFYVNKKLFSKDIADLVRNTLRDILNVNYKDFWINLRATTVEDIIIQGLAIACIVSHVTYYTQGPTGMYLYIFKQIESDFLRKNTMVFFNDIETQNIDEDKEGNSTGNKYKRMDTFPFPIKKDNPAYEESKRAIENLFEDREIYIRFMLAFFRLHPSDFDMFNCVRQHGQ